MFLFGRKRNKTSSRQDEQAPAYTKVSSPEASSERLKSANVCLGNYIAELKKERGIDLSDHYARVSVVLDISGSMEVLYKNGSIQELLTRLLPLALRFDDNGELEVFIFNTICTQLNPMTLRNYKDYVQCEITSKGHHACGGTKYAPAVNLTIDNYNDGSPYPAFIIFITDGDNSDKEETDLAIRTSSYYRNFYQFVGIGGENFSYLQKLDDLNGRQVDNTAFVKVSDFAQLTDEELYAKLLDQYPQWLRAMH